MDSYELPIGKKAIDCKWVFKAKQDENGHVQRYNARRVAKGYFQKYREDYDNLNSPFVKHTAIRVLLSLAASMKNACWTSGVKMAFLHREIEEELCMQQPPGFTDPKTKYLVCKLQKVIYGLKQAASVEWETEQDPFKPRLYQK